MNGELIGRKVPSQEYTIEVPPQYQAVYPKLQEAAKMGGEIYLVQNQLEEEASRKGIERDSEMAHHPLTIPDKESSKWLFPQKHPELIPLLRKAQGFLLSAASLSEDAGDDYLAGSLYAQGNALVNGERIKAWREYLKGGTPINFHLLQIETEKGKERWQGYLGIRNNHETPQMEGFVTQLRSAGRKIYGKWFTPQTIVSVDDVGVMAGYIAPQVQSEARQTEGLFPDFDLSAQNIPNPGELKRKSGSRITIFNGSFQYVLHDLDRTVAPFMLELPTKKAYLRSLAAHENDHDDWPDNGTEEERLGMMLGPLSESHANTGGVLIAAEAWPLSTDFGTLQHPFSEVIYGWLGYTLRDCAEYLTGRKSIPDLETLARVDIHKPGSLAALNLFIEERVIKIENGKIINVDLDKALALCRRLEPQEKKILYCGTKQDAMSYFTEILPKNIIF